MKKTMQGLSVSWLSSSSAAISDITDPGNGKICSWGLRDSHGVIAMKVGRIQWRLGVVCKSNSVHMRGRREQFCPLPTAAS